MAASPSRVAVTRQPSVLLARVSRCPAPGIALAAAVLVGILTVLCFAPRYWLWPVVGLPLGDFISLQPEFHRAFYGLQQLDDPWQRITNVTNRVIEWRLLFPVIGSYLGLPGWLYLALPHLGCLATLTAVAHRAWYTSRDLVVTVSTTALMATTSWFFVSTGWLAYFDSWLVLALLLATFAQSRWVLFGAALLAPWIDERFILGLPLCGALRPLLLTETPRSRADLGRDVAALLLGILPYLAARAGGELLGFRATGQGYWSGRALQPASAGVMVWGAVSGLRLGWVLIGFWLWRGVSSSWRLGLLGVTTATLLVNLFVADDLSRATVVLMPLPLAAALAGGKDGAGRRRLLPWLALGNLLLPAEHVIAAAGDPQASSYRLPILSLPAERARDKEPPYFASPYVYNRRGTDAYAAGNAEAGERAFTLALRLEPGFDRTRANRGILRLRAGDRTGGMAELDAALAGSPWIFEARLQRAVFRQQAGDLAGALEDVRLALRYMPPDFPKRAEAEQYAEQLRQALAGR